jgi:hypothetical protein
MAGQSDMQVASALTEASLQYDAGILQGALQQELESVGAGLSSLRGLAGQVCVASGVSWLWQGARNGA